MSKDLKGRDYAKITEVKAGDRIELDGDFTCHKAGEVVVEDKGHGLFFGCRDGEHHLCGQVQDDYYIGIYKL